MPPDGVPSVLPIKFTVAMTTSFAEENSRATASSPFHFSEFYFERIRGKNLVANAEEQCWRRERKKTFLIKKNQVFIIGSKGKLRNREKKKRKESAVTLYRMHKPEAAVVVVWRTPSSLHPPRASFSLSFALLPRSSFAPFHPQHYTFIKTNNKQ